MRNSPWEDMEDPGAIPKTEALKQSQFSDNLKLSENKPLGMILSGKG
jgi:hypothetical protein